MNGNGHFTTYLVKIVSMNSPICSSRNVLKLKNIVTINRSVDIHTNLFPSKINTFFNRRYYNNKNTASKFVFSEIFV